MSDEIQYRKVSWEKDGVTIEFSRMECGCGSPLRYVWGFENISDGSSNNLHQCVSCAKVYVTDQCDRYTDEELLAAGYTKVTNPNE
jgi:hypothetical protein